uniref:Reverse transcriptase domain-containing protein n=2 Tax=Salarias fasciatus TaxID=181472 RepID=A0A672I8N9_SALFA
MAARVDAATSRSPDNALFKCLSESFSCQSKSEYEYSRQAFFHIRRSKICRVLTTELEYLLKELGLLRCPANSPDSPATPPPVRRRRKRCARTRKRGKRGGVRARLEAKPTRPAIPSILLANVRSLDSKMDDIRLLRSANRKVSDCCVLVFTETWLNDNIPDSAIQLEQLTCYRSDRALVEGGKIRGGGVCVYIREAWCQDATVVYKHCSPLAEFMIVKCRPFYLPREMSSILLVATYIPPTNNSNRSAALTELYQAISEQQTAQPDGFIILAGDFNHADLKTVLPKFHQHIHFPTRGDSILDFVYTQHKGAYKATPLPHIGASDHLTIMLLPAYRQRVKVIKPALKEVRVWPQGATSALQDCFGTTDWEMFKEAATCNNLIDVEEYTDTVTSYITKCIDDVTHIKNITIRANRKPWLTGDVHRLLKARDIAFKAGDESALRTARANLSRGIRKAKQDHTNKITSYFKDSKNAQSLWQGIQAITDYKPAPRSCESDITLLNNLNSFFARFEEQNTTRPQKTPPPSHDQPLCLSAASVKRTLSAINTRKAAGPDNIPGSVLKDCAEELKDVFTDIFNTSLRQAIVPSGFKATTIIPVPKKSSPSCFNDYRPVALTSIIMKCFERLVLSHIKSTLPPSLDPYQFAYRAKRSTDDAICSALHPALTHLEKKDSYVRMLFIDFSSAFNTIIPQQLICKLDKLGLSTSLCNWLLDFLSQRPQVVRVGNNISSSITLSTGAPQGCVLSPLLFTLLTHDCISIHSSNHLVKFADDTTLVGLITNSDETHYRKEVELLTRWCTDNNLLLNVSKTKEIVVSFRRSHTQYPPLTINGVAVERVSSTKFLGVYISDDLSWTTNTTALAKKAQQRLYFLRKLKRVSVPPPIMITFYRGTIESILTSCITVWGGSCTDYNRKALQRIVRTAERIIGAPLSSLQDLYTTRLTRKAITIVSDANHPAHSLFTLLPSGRRYRSLRSRTTRLTNSFIHQAVRLLNSLPSRLSAPARRNIRLAGGV